MLTLLVVLSYFAVLVVGFIEQKDFPEITKVSDFAFTKPLLITILSEFERKEFIDTPTVIKLIGATLDRGTRHLTYPEIS